MAAGLEEALDSLPTARETPVTPSTLKKLRLLKVISFPFF
jgi:hypothetical protein